MKRALALLLAVVMVLSMVSVSVFAKTSADGTIKFYSKEKNVATGTDVFATVEVHIDNVSNGKAVISSGSWPSTNPTAPEGKAFDYWVDESSTKVSSVSDLKFYEGTTLREVYPVFKDKESAYKVTLYKVNGFKLSEVEPTFVQKGGPNHYEVTVPETYQTAGYIWKDQNGTEVEETDDHKTLKLPADKSVTALYAKIHTKTLTYNTDGGEFGFNAFKNRTKAGDVAVGSAVKTPTKLTKRGYDFAGWYTRAYKGNSDNYDETPWTSGDPMPAEDLTLYAKWTPKQFTLFFSPVGGTPSKLYETATFGAKYPELADFTPLDPLHTDFGGWYHGLKKIEKGDTVEDIPALGDTMILLPKLDAKVFAVWIDGDGNVIKTDRIDQGAFAEYEGDVPTKTATAQYTYTFKNWWPREQRILLDTEFYAQFDATLNQYTITFDANGGDLTGAASQTKYYGETFDETTDPVWDGYEFEGWFEEGATAPYDFSKMVESDVVLHAKWRLDPLIPILTILSGELPFDDVSFFDWNYDAVSFCYQNGLVNGVAYNKFAPKSCLTRGMVVTMLWRLAGQPTAPACKFADVKDDAYYYNAVNWAADCGIVVGVSENKFAPDANVTVEQLMTILTRFAHFVGRTISGKGAVPYADAANVSDYAKQSVEFAYWNDMLHVYDGKLNPQGAATREQAAYAFYGLCK